MDLYNQFGAATCTDVIDLMCSGKPQDVVPGILHVVSSECIDDYLAVPDIRYFFILDTDISDEAIIRSSIGIRNHECSIKGRKCDIIESILARDNIYKMDLRRVADSSFLVGYDGESWWTFLICPKTDIHVVARFENIEEPERLPHHARMIARGFSKRAPIQAPTQFMEQKSSFYISPKQ